MVQIPHTCVVEQLRSIVWQLLLGQLGVEIPSHVLETLGDHEKVSDRALDETHNLGTLA